MLKKTALFGQGSVAKIDSSNILRLKDAGALLLGTTNTPQMVMSFETSNTLYGRTVNAHDSTRSAGGSSGGEGAIIAAKGSPLGIGTDVGGSIRIPAHFNGICGLKSTKGAVPLTNCMYFGEGFAYEEMVPLTGEIATIGPMSRYPFQFILHNSFFFDTI